MEMPFQFQKLSIPEVILIEFTEIEDERGLFAETYKASEFKRHGILESFIQDNYSVSSRGVLRGLHYQLNPQAQGKLVMAVIGEIHDVAVDLRQKSPTYGNWVDVILSARKHQMLYVPPGFAHGFCVLSERAHISYKATSEYAPELERGIIWNDPDIGINWPITNPRLSPKDLSLPYFKEAEINF
jgi:dTDP-4-dehydrorhamnose 3,5-epimerase